MLNVYLVHYQVSGHISIVTDPTVRLNIIFQFCSFLYCLMSQCQSTVNTANAFAFIFPASVRGGDQQSRGRRDGTSIS